MEVTPEHAAQVAREAAAIADQFAKRGTGTWQRHFALALPVSVEELCEALEPVYA